MPQNRVTRPKPSGITPAVTDHNPPGDIAPLAPETRSRRPGGVVTHNAGPARVVPQMAPNSKDGVVTMPHPHTEQGFIDNEGVTGVEYSG